MELFIETIAILAVVIVIAMISISDLKRRITVLEQKVSRLQPPAAFHDTASLADESVDDPEEAVDMPQAPPARDTPEPEWAREEDAPALPAAARSWLSEPATPSKPTPITVIGRAVKRWFTHGNVPVKVGMLVLLSGLAALIKYASDQGWLSLPIEWRLAGIGAAALGGLIFAWRKRHQHRTFALSLQGGMIGVLLLLVYAAFRYYTLIPVSMAFVVSVVMIAGAGVLAIVQNARVLAAFVVLAGFLAPIWLSTGEGGSHLVLFAYYAVLNAAILVMAWFKPWRLLNLIGFAFTFGMGTLWGVLDYQASDWISAQLFLALFFLFYLLLPLLYAWRSPARKRDIIDGCLVFGTPLVAFSLQAGLLGGDTFTLALYAMGGAALYAVLARGLMRHAHFKALTFAYALLAVGFATLAIPLALSAHVTSCVYALEGACLIWLGVYQSRLLPQLTGAALQAMAASILVAHGYWDESSELLDLILLSGSDVFGAFMIAVAGMASAVGLRRAGSDGAAAFAYVWGLWWWCVAGFTQELSMVGPHYAGDALLMFTMATGWLAAEVNRHYPASVLRGTLLLALLAVVPFALFQAVMSLLEPRLNEWWVWLPVIAMAASGLVGLRSGTDGIARAAQFVWWLLWATIPVLMPVLGMLNDTTTGWHIAALALPALVITALSLTRSQWLSWPLGPCVDTLQPALRRVLLALLWSWWLCALFQPGDSLPLPWVVVLNPIDLMQLAILVVTGRSLYHGVDSSELSQVRGPMLLIMSFLWVTCLTLRVSYHWSGGALDWDASLFLDSFTQTCLTVVWSVLGMAGWIVGSRRRQRLLWLAGAILMGGVLAKLVLIDRYHLGDLWGIVSFIVYGLLCTVIGFFAPAPPRQRTAQDKDAQS